MSASEYEVERVLDPHHGGTVLVGRREWDLVAEARRRFIDEGELPEAAPWLRPEIVESWKRCRSVGVDPDSTALALPLSEEDSRQVAAVYGGLVEAARPLMGVIDDLDLAEDYIFELVARNGVTVLRLGNLDLHSIVAENSVMNEPTMGTNAHTLCMRQKTPLQVVGPEHYCSGLHGLAALAAPIFDQHGIVIASLLLTQPLPPDPWLVDYQKLLSHALGFVASICSALEHQMAFQDSLAMLAATDEKLEAATKYGQSARHVLDIAVGFTHEPILVLDASGVIQHASPEAVHLLHLTMPDVVGLPAETVLGSSWPEAFHSLSDGGRHETTVTVGGRELSLRGNVVRQAPDGGAEGLVLRLARAKSPRARAAGDAGEEASITFADILGSSPAMSEARSLARRYAMTTENVLIVGESGTGKEYFAQAIHNASRAKGPFMAVNCAAIPPRLIESELFGYESGAFTGAERGGKPGKIELADGGTLFLDEIGDMPLELQATLLRVLENKRVMRLGGKAYRQVDFRVVAATNRDLGAMVREGAFREDLLYRLSILTVPLPPLRERNGDVVFFARYFLNECRLKAHEGPGDFSPDAERAIATFPWPGNVRQIKNAVYSAFYAAPGDVIAAEDLPQYVREGRDDLIAPVPAPAAPARPSGVPAEPAGPTPATPAAPAGAAPAPAAIAPDSAADELLVVPGELLSLQAVEESAIKLAMVYAGGSVAKAAEILEISKATLYRKIKEYGLRQ